MVTWVERMKSSPRLSIHLTESLLPNLSSYSLGKNLTLSIKSNPNLDYKNESSERGFFFALLGLRNWFFEGDLLKITPQKTSLQSILNRNL